MKPAPPVTSTHVFFMRAAPSIELPVDGVERPALDLALDPSEVLADEREDEPLDAEDEHYAGAAEERAGKVALGDPVDDSVDAEPGCGQRADDAEPDADPLDRLRPEPGQDVQRESRQPQRRVAGGARSGRVGDVDLGHACAPGEDQRLRALLPPDRAEHRLHRGAPVRVERAAEVADV